MEKKKNVRRVRKASPRRSLRKDTRGAAVTEYALVIGLIVLAIIAAAGPLQGAVSDMFLKISQKIGVLSNQVGGPGTT